MPLKCTPYSGQKVLAVLAVIALISSGAYFSTVFGQDAPRPAGDTFQTTVLPVLAKNCFSCHSDRLQTSGLSLEAFHEPSQALQKPDVWVKVLDKLKPGTM